MSTMTPAGSGGTTSTTVPGGASGGSTTILSLLAADTTYTFEFPTNTKGLMVRLRSTDAELRFSYSSAAMDAGQYFTIPRTNVLSIDDFSLTAAMTLYFQSNKSTQTLEIEYRT